MFARFISSCCNLLLSYHNGSLSFVRESWNSANSTIQRTLLSAFWRLLITCFLATAFIHTSPSPTTTTSITRDVGLRSSQLGPLASLKFLDLWKLLLFWAQHAAKPARTWSSTTHAFVRSRSLDLSISSTATDDAFFGSCSSTKIYNAIYRLNIRRNHRRVPEPIAQRKPQ